MAVAMPVAMPVAMAVAVASAKEAGRQASVRPGAGRGLLLAIRSAPLAKRPSPCWPRVSEAFEPPAAGRCAIHNLISTERDIHGAKYLRFDIHESILTIRYLRSDINGAMSKERDTCDSISTMIIFPRLGTHDSMFTIRYSGSAISTERNTLGARYPLSDIHDTNTGCP